MQTTEKHIQQLAQVRSVIFDSWITYVEYNSRWQGNRLAGQTDWHAKMWELNDSTIPRLLSRLVTILNLQKTIPFTFENQNFIPDYEIRASVEEYRNQWLDALATFPDQMEIEDLLAVLVENMQLMEQTSKLFVHSA
ncbi:hypothetical protein ACFOG5_23620 [Pedobacter fastidiosus]|uniref:Uncharacterized protein n=1 Tax=Pedobacter fastidiosus TaxID=2765361 RepID=A0ABR7KXP4_9SPHI|nr:hypothetical protein [Pedobacter fastidiosus]MBC6112783.1 hypothetical protein [Pedobacter fastidiosus]